MGHFLSDYNKSQEAVDTLKTYFSSLGWSVRELSREEQKLGDLEISRGSELLNIEVKFDIMSKRTGNLCFEMSNGSRKTGILETQADRIYYVIPGKKHKNIFIFEPTKLRDYLESSNNVIIKNGGDKGKFILGLVKISNIIADELMEDFLVVTG